MMWHHYHGWSWLWMAGTMLAFWGTLLAVVIAAIRASSRPSLAADPAIATLGQRLGAGETSQEDCERIHKVARGRP